jgi:beta-lactamase regulating signal transducer with metallopeptidase domain
VVVCLFVWLFVCLFLVFLVVRVFAWLFVIFSECLAVRSADNATLTPDLVNEVPVASKERLSEKTYHNG